MIAKTLTLTALSTLALTWGCGGAEEAADTTDDTATTGSETTADSDVVPSPPTPWEEMSFDEKKSWMALEVMPRIGPMFEAYDSTRFAGFGCDGCHGEDGQARNFEMPNPSIYTLYATGSQEQVDMVDEMRPMVNFMFQEVVPTMKTLLGAADFDPETQEGFSCYYCHPNGGEGTPAEG